MGLVRRKKRTPEQIAATNAKRAATIAAKKDASSFVKRLDKSESAGETEMSADDITRAESARVEVAKAEVRAEVREKEAIAEVAAEVKKEKKEELPRPLPKKLQDRIEAMAGIQDDLSKEIAEFKSGEAYLEGDLPITLHGLSGPGFSPGQRSLNFIDEKCLDPLWHYRWSHKSMVDYHRADGYEPVNHVEFSRMVIARGGGHSFGKTAEGALPSSPS